VEQIKAIVGETLHDIVDPLVFAEAANLIADHKLLGRDVVVVSASGEEIVGPIAKGLGATHAMATRMVVEDGKYTGEVAYYCFGEANGFPCYPRITGSIALSSTTKSYWRAV